MPSEVLKDIENRFTTAGLKRCKIELFSLWLQRTPDASWDQIALALEKCDEITMADRIRKCHLPPSLPAATSLSMPPSLAGRDADFHFMPPSQDQDDVDQQRQPVKLVRVEKEMVIQFRKLEKCYAKLIFNLKTTLDEKVPPVILKLGRYLIGLLMKDKELLQATTIDELFQLIEPHFCFLNTAILGDIIDEFLGGEPPLKHQLEEYEYQLEQFKESTIMVLLQEISPQCSPSVGAPQIIIKLTNCWVPEVTNIRFRKFVEQIFEENSTSLANINVWTGCICVAWLAHKSAIPSLIAQAQEKTEFMQLVGVLRVSVAGIDILEQEEEKDTFLSSALLHATRTDCVNAVDMLLYRGADPNSSTVSGLTPLIVACSCGNIEIAKLLLQARANINQQQQHGATALIAACYSQTPNGDIVRLIIQSGADISIKTSRLQRTALMYATQRGHTSIVEYLLDEGAPVNTQDVDGATSLMLASQLGHSETVRVLINYGADVNILARSEEVYQTALMLACYFQKTVCVDLLLAGGADPNLCGRRFSPLFAACTTGDQPMDPTILDKLLSAGANPDAQTAEHGSTALITAASYGYEKGVEILLNAAADVNIQNSDGATALHAAAEKGHLAFCKILLASGALASVTASSGRTPFDLAQRNGHHYVCELLRSAMDSDPNPATQEKVTKPVQDSSRPFRSTILPTIKPRRGILPSITSIGQYIKELLLPDRAIKDRAIKDRAIKDRAIKDRAIKDRAIKDCHSDQTQETSSTAND